MTTLSWGDPELVGAPLSRRLAENAAAWLPALVIAYPLLVWPLVQYDGGDAGQELSRAAREPESHVANRLFFPLAFLCAAACAAVVPLVRLRPLGHATFVLMGAFLLLAATSAAWALAPDVTIRRVVQQILVLGAVVLPLLAARDARAVLDRLFFVMAVTALLNAAFAVLDGRGPIGYEGIYSQKNMLGAATTTILLVALYQFVACRGSMRLWAALVCGIAAALLVLSESKTSLGLAVMVPLAAAALIVAARALRLSAALIVACTLCILVLAYALGAAFHVWDFPRIAAALFGDPTMTGRTEIWAFGWEMAGQRPWLGYGYQSFWNLGYEAPSYREAPGFVALMPHAHNGYLDLLLQTGWIGLAVVLTMLVVALHASVSPRLPTSLNWLILSTVLINVLHNLMETTLFQGYSYNWLLLVFVMALAAGARHGRP